MKYVLRRRIAAAEHRKDDKRTTQLKVMLSLLCKGQASAGQVLLDLQFYAKVLRNREPVVRQASDSKERKGWKSDKHRKQPASDAPLRGGL